MSEKELVIILKELGIPLAYRAFSKKQTPPYSVWYRENNENVYADDHIHISTKNIVFEVYFAQKNFEFEEKTAEILQENEINYTVYETYIEEEKLHLITYEFAI